MAARILTDYPRRAHLEFYRSNPSPFYAVTFELEASRVRARAREVGGSTYAALCWAFHRAMLKVEAFRTRLDGENVVLHDTLRIGMTVPGPGRTFTFATHEWNESGEAFLEAAGIEIARSSGAVNLNRGGEPDFAYYTAVPGVPFLGITHAPHRDRTAGQPMTAFGKFREDRGRLFVPVGLQVNHMYVDGIDVSDLYEGAQASFTDAF
ncbi:MAG TPA: CatA-like O-acetyltransferase [Vicinamibacteria bacterium]|nr:CatA-like O-acetyltransferase [Vicinamibacteria bacterium]